PESRKVAQTSAKTLAYDLGGERGIHWMLKRKVTLGNYWVEAFCCCFFGVRVLEPYLCLQGVFSLSIAAILCGKRVGLCLSLCVIAGIVALEFLSLICAG
ncbi:MAG: hypothetical protein ACI8YB_000681, partial [Patiriisocius sp.]